MCGKWLLFYRIWKIEFKPKHSAHPTHIQIFKPKTGSTTVLPPLQKQSENESESDQELKAPLI
jgi:hypothetical protein